MIPQILEITSEQTLCIRHKSMWPSKPLNYVRLANDSEGRHFGLYINDEMISVISLFVKNQEAQFRKFATIPNYQGKGYGTLLLKRILSIVKDDHIYKIWCNARVDKSMYYARFGMVETNNNFTKGGIDYVIMEKTLTEVK